jgi:hypothetical protein
MIDFRISKHSMSVLAGYSDERFVDRLAALVGDEDEPPSVVRQRCRELMARARERGFATEFEVATFVACGFTEGDDFDQQADSPYARILENPQAGPRAKAEMLAMMLERSEAANDDEGED